MTIPRRNPTENDVENRLMIKVPMMIIPNWIMAVHIAAAFNAIDASVFRRFVTEGFMKMKFTLLG